MVAIFTTLVAGLARVAPALIIVVVVVEEAGEPPTELEANVITGDALIVVAAVEITELEKLGEVIVGIITGVILVAVVCGLIAVQGGPPGHPFMTS